MKRNMQTDPTTPPHTSLAETLENALASEDQSGLSIGELTDAVGEKGLWPRACAVVTPQRLACTRARLQHAVWHRHRTTRTTNAHWPPNRMAARTPATHPN